MMKKLTIALCTW